MSMTPRPSFLVLLGPPGAGKGTQGGRLAASMGVPAISTGDIFRQNVSDESEMGLTAKRYMDAGEYVPDDVTNAMVADRLGRADARGGFILDGYPRTVAQVDRLDEILAASGAELQTVLEITADPDEIVERLTRRAGEQGRADDSEDVVRRRLEVYREQTAPLVDLYSRRGLLVSVDGMGEVDEVGRRIGAVLAQTPSSR